MKKDKKISTGISGLDEILMGGLLPQQSYLIEGGPGTGKSTFGYHFLDKGIKEGEKCMYLSLGETDINIIKNAAKFGLNLKKAKFVNLNDTEDFISDHEVYTVFPTDEIEKESIFDVLIEQIKDFKPDRVFLDSIMMFGFLKNNPFQTRKLALSFINFICNTGATLVMTSEQQVSPTGADANFWVDGIIDIEYNPDWRKLSVVKYRGSDFRHGNHAFKMNEIGITVYPSLQPSRYNRNHLSDAVSSGIDELDKQMHGGVEQGTVSLVTGPTGVGKTNLCIQFMKEAASRGDRSAVYSFEESVDLIIKRSEAINIPVKQMIKSGNLQISSIEPLSMSPDEFSKIVRSDVEENGTKFVLIDSMGGYGLAVREERTLHRLHSLLVYLQNMGVTTFLINETQSITGGMETTNMHASYLADNIIFLRYLEMNGELHKAIGILKKRLSDFEKTIREFIITKDGIVVGEALTNVSGILSGSAQVHKD